MYEVYLLDDEKWLLESLYKAIDWNSLNSTVVGKSTNSLEAYKYIKYNEPHIVFTDIRMPDLNGIELMEKLKKQGSKSVFIVITGHAEFEYVQKALQNDAIGYCLKPFEEGEIRDVLLKAQKVCEDRRLLHSLKHDSIDYTSKTSNNIYNRACDIIKEQFKTNISLQKIADELHINSSYCSDLFKKNSGMTYSDYLTKLRIDYACSLLLNTTLSVNEVAEKSGFSNYFYFARKFKKKIGLTPTQYRDKE